MLGRRVVVYGGGNTALDVARTAKRLGATEAIIVYRRTREKMPAHDFELEEALAGRRDGEVALDHQAGRAKARSPSRRWRSTRRAFRSPPASSRRSRPIRWCSRSARTSTSSLLDRRAGPRGSTTAWSRSAPNMMTGHPGIFAGGDMVPVGAHRDGRRRPRQEGRAPHRRLAARRRRTRRPPKHELATLRQAEHLVLLRRAEDGAADARHGAPPVDLRRGGAAASTRPTRCSRRAAACRAATASSATTATASAPTTR